jgi:hypothetical protein
VQPIGAQAGTQAIIDARVLTAAANATSNPAEALESYDTERRTVMNESILRNRQEAASQLVEERASKGFVLGSMMRFRPKISRQYPPRTPWQLASTS